MSTLFNRKDATVIQFALNNDLEAFLEKYNTTSASTETLQKAYEEICKNKTKSTIAVTSGDGKPNEPLTPIIPKDDKEYGINKEGEIEVPKSLRLKGGKLIKATPNPEATLTPAATTKEGAKSKAAAKPKTAKDSSKPSKRDAIKAYLSIEGNSTKTNKEIRDAILAKGYPSCYDSEISAVKSKL